MYMDESEAQNGCQKSVSLVAVVCRGLHVSFDKPDVDVKMMNVFD